MYGGQLSEQWRARGSNNSNEFGSIARESNAKIKKVAMQKLLGRIGRLPSAFFVCYRRHKNKVQQIDFNIIDFNIIDFNVIELRGSNEQLK